MKKLLFILILLIPFVIKAESDFELAKMWDSELPSTYGKYYYMNDKHVRVNYNEISSVDALTGETKIVSFKDSNNSRYAIYDNRILFIASRSNGTGIDIYLYNENLTQLSKETIDYFEIDHCRMYNNKYIILSGTTKFSDEYTRFVYFIDSDGKVYKSDYIRTLNYTYKYLNENDNTYYYMDKYDNTYTIDNYQIVSNKQNSDGSYLVNYEDKIIKFNSDNALVKEITIPNGHNPKLVKKGNAYFVIANTNTRINGYFNYKVLLYKMDGNLNLTEPAITFPTDYIATASTHPLGPTYFEWDYYHLYNRNNKIYMDLKGSSGTSYYEVNDDLTITPIDSFYIPQLEYTNDYRYDDLIYEDSDMVYHINRPPSSPSEETKELFNSPDDPSNLGRAFKTITDKDGNLYLNILSTSNGSSKLEFAKVNSSGELVFKKTIYDYTMIAKDDFCSGYVDNDLNFFDDYIVVASNSTSQNIIKFYDYDGNEIYDLSQDVNNYPNLSYVGMKIYPRGIYFEYAERTSGCIGGVSAYTNNLPETKVLEAQDVVPRTYMVYYELPFLVNTKVNGAGTVTAKQIRALTGSSVEFTVTPDPGYVLSVVKVIDSKGNVLTFTNNTFVMPSSDVVIEATFVPINPNTQTFISYIILGICALAGLLTVYLSSKKKQYE